MPIVPLIPATLAFVDGIPYAAAFGDVYHSADGGLAQARHVFLSGNGLPERWRNRDRFVIFETGFGLGLNFLATWKAWRDDPLHAERLHYVAIEKHPFSAVDLAQLHAMWPDLAPLSGLLQEVWPVLVPGFHRLLLDGGRVSLTLIFGDVGACLPQMDAVVDAFFLDGFAPGKNPDMWSPDILKRLPRLAAPDATLATYTVSAAVRKSLGEAGFLCEKRPGFGRKREMLTARFAPHWPIPPRRQGMTSRHAIVLGAGLAGCAVSERLAARGWQVTLIERHAAPAEGASGNRAGIVMPLLSKDDNMTSRLTRAAYLFSLHIWQQLGGIGGAFTGEACGVLACARDEDDAQMQQWIAGQGHYPADFAQWLDAAAVTSLLKDVRVDGGWLFPQGGWVQPASVCRAMLAAGRERIDLRFAQEATRLERVHDQWQVSNSQGQILAIAPTLILANGAQATAFSQTAGLPLSAIRGQVTHVAAEMLPAWPVVVCGEGYVTRPCAGICSVGATYDRHDDPVLRDDSQQDNLARLAQILPGSAMMKEDVPLAGRVGFRCVAADRLPLVGALPDEQGVEAMRGSRLRDVPRLPGLYGLFGYGSRGLIWASFAAELLAAQLEGEPMPVERALVDALDPARFALKAHRRGQTVSSLYSTTS